MSIVSIDSSSVMQRVAGAQKVIVKFGTSSLVDENHSGNNSIDIATLSRHVADISQLWRAGIEVVIVTSGARGLGVRGEEGDGNIATTRGIYRLLDIYADLFMEHGGIEVGLMLLTKTELEGKKVRKRISSRINSGFSSENTLMIINENDAISHRKITFGDNDGLAAEIARLLRADVLVFMSREERSELGKGGPNTKKKAIRTAAKSGIVPLVADGRGEHVIRQLFDGTQSEALRDALRNSQKIAHVTARPLRIH